MGKVKLEMNKHGNSLSLTIEDSKIQFSASDINTILVTAGNCLDGRCHCHDHGQENVSDASQKASAKEELLPLPREYQLPKDDSADRYGIRQRLPNNVVDVNELTIKAATTDNALIRCPKCGQAHAVIVSDNVNFYLMRKHYLSNEFGIIMDSPGIDEGSLLHLSCDGDTPEDKLSYFYKLQGMPITEDRDFAVINETELFCPVCHQSSQFIDWKEAWHEPLKFFENENICEACGGECVSQIDTSKEGILVCDSCHKKWLDKALADKKGESHG